MALGLKTFKPATPAGVITLLKHYNINTEGLHAIVIGRSDIVGNPMSALLRMNTSPGNCTVTQCLQNCGFEISILFKLTLL